MVGIRLFPFGAPASFQGFFQGGYLACWSLWKFESSEEVEPVFPTLFRTLCKTNNVESKNGGDQVDRRWCYSRKRPRRVLLRKALSSKTVFEDCHQRLPKVLPNWCLSFKDCHQRLPKVPLKWWLSIKIVIKDCPKFCRIDACPLKIVIKDCPKFRWSDGCP